MVLQMTRAVAVMAGCGALAACGEATSPESDAYLAYFNESVALDAEVDGLPEVDAPTQGSATYFGVAGLRLDSDPDPASVAETSILGEAVLVADFDGGAVTGTFGEFVGVVNGGPARFFAGELVMSADDLGQGNPAQFTASVTGELSDSVHVVGVDAMMLGEFRGLGGSPDAIIAASGGNLDILGTSVFTLDGDVHDGQIGVVATQ